MGIVMPTASLKAKYLSQKLLLMKKSEECFIGNCIYPAKLFIKNLFAKGSLTKQSPKYNFSDADKTLLSAIKLFKKIFMLRSLENTAALHNILTVALVVGTNIRLLPSKYALLISPESNPKNL